MSALVTAPPAPDPNKMASVNDDTAANLDPKELIQTLFAAKVAGGMAPSAAAAEALVEATAAAAAPSSASAAVLTELASTSSPSDPPPSTAAASAPAAVSTEVASSPSSPPFDLPPATAADAADVSTIQSNPSAEYLATLEQLRAKEAALQAEVMGGNWEPEILFELADTKEMVSSAELHLSPFGIIEALSTLGRQSRRCSDTKAVEAPEEKERVPMLERGVTLVFLRRMVRELAALGRPDIDAGQFCNGV